MTCPTIVPPYLLERLLQHEERFPRAAARAREALTDRPPHVRAAVDGTSSSPGLDRHVSDARHGTELPGHLVRGEGAAPTGDAAVDEAYDGLGATYAFFYDVFARASIDDRGMDLLATVHYGRGYDNAYWDGRQMVFGDGDDEVFRRFTISLSVIGHELTHGVTEHTANLTYQGQSGALNESISDVFGVMVEQYQRGQDAAEASWLVGEGLFTDQVQGAALRSMAAPGTAYDDDVLGKDPQPGHMDDYIDTTDDNGGVHLNSGIPNRAFYLVATALGGQAWQVAGPIWYRTLTAGLAPDTDFVTFARATVEAAQADGDAVVQVVDQAWRDVGVLT